MLYDKRWDKPEIKADPFSLESFAAWLETQDAAREYDWIDVCGCVCHEYLSAMGLRRAPYPKRDCDGGRLSSIFPSIEVYHKVCGTHPHTFGAALDRARKALAEL